MPDLETQTTSIPALEPFGHMSLDLVPLRLEHRAETRLQGKRTSSTAEVAGPLRLSV